MQWGERRTVLTVVVVVVNTGNRRQSNPKSIENNFNFKNCTDSFQMAAISGSSAAAAASDGVDGAAH